MADGGVNRTCSYLGCYLPGSGEYNTDVQTSIDRLTYTMRLFYRKIGEGPPIIILHGLFGSSENWLTIAKKISTRFTVYLPDQRNHGLSPHDEIHNYESMSDDLFELITELNLKKFFLAGHSMGGKTAMKFAMKWPEMIQGLIIADISPFGNRTNDSQDYNEHYEILRSITETDISKAASRTDIDKLFAESLTFTLQKIYYLLLN